MKKIRPDVIIGGAPKCGTTSLFNWLSKSLDIHSSNTKETNFLLDKESWLYNKFSYHEMGEEGYQRYFDKKHNDKLLLESCAIYLYSETALSFVEKNPDVKVLFILRNPYLRTISNYKYFFEVNQQHETLDLEEYIKKLLNKDKISSNEQVNDALEHSLYSQYLTSWLARTNPNQIKIITLEELEESPKDVLHEISSWIGVKTSYIEEINFEKENQSYKPKNSVLHSIGKIASKLIPEGTARNFIKRKYIKFNSLKNSDSVIPDSLRGYYDTDILKTERLIGKDLTKWLSKK